MTTKSDVLVLDVFHKNKTKSIDMVFIMREMASYTLGHHINILSCLEGNHVMCEREQAAKRHVVCSNTWEGQLE